MSYNLKDVDLADNLNLADTGATLDDLLHVVEWGELIFVWRLCEVTNLSDIDICLAPVVLCEHGQLSIIF